MGFLGNFELTKFKSITNNRKHPTMSSNLRIVKICALCKHEFIAKKTTSQTCSDPCAKRFYKVKMREKAISRAEAETVVKRKPQAFVNEDQVRAIQAKDRLTEEGLNLRSKRPRRRKAAATAWKGLSMLNYTLVVRWILSRMRCLMAGNSGR